MSFLGKLFGKKEKEFYKKFNRYLKKNVYGSPRGYIPFK
jgi:hypothetical protein